MRRATSAALLSLGVFTAVAPASAQLVLDGSLLDPSSSFQGMDCPTECAIPVTGGEYSITDDHGVFSAGGESRYHSFSQFDLRNPNFDAVLRSDATPQRVLIRVTQSRSRLNAGLRSEIPGADVYFFNPFGITFERGGEIDVSGSFYASTADAIHFPEGADAIFPTGTTAVPALLSVSAPSAFVFAADFPQDVIVEARGFSVPAGETLSISAGKVEVRALSGDDANFVVPAASLNLAAVAGPAEIPVDFSAIDAAALPAPDEGCVAGCVQLRSDSGIRAGTDDGSAPAGRVVIRAGRFEMELASLVAEESTSGTVAGEIDIAVRDALVLGDDSEIASLASGLGAAPDIRLSGARVEIEGSRVASEARSTGDGGDVSIDAGTLRVSNESGRSDGSFVLTNTLLATPGGGRGGDLAVDADRVELVSGGRLRAVTQGTGDAGDIGITAAESIEVRGALTGIAATSTASAATTLGASGDLRITAPEVVVADGGFLTVSTIGTEDAGRLKIVADSVEIGGVDASGVGAGVFAQSNLTTTEAGGGGAIDIRTTGDLTVRDGGRVSVLTRGGDGASGAAGTLTLESGGRITVRDGGSVEAESNGGGDGGSITLAAARGVSVRDGGAITAVATKTGDAGDIAIDAGPSFELLRASITTEAAQASGGRIEIAARDLVVVQDARITTSVRDGAGGGGDVTIARPTFLFLDSGRIVARADEGAGGNIRLAAENFLASPDSIVDASSNLGIDGEIVIESPNAELTGKLASLPQGYLNASALLGDACLARTATEGSIVIQRATLPPPPDAAFRVDAGQQVCAPTGGTP